MATHVWAKNGVTSHHSDINCVCVCVCGGGGGGGGIFNAIATINRGTQITMKECMSSKSQ